MHRGIYRPNPVGHPSPATVGHAALLFAGGGLRTRGALAGPCAAALLGLDDRQARARPQVVLGPDVHRLQPRGLTYRFEVLSAAEVASVGGLACTSPARTLQDVATTSTAADLLVLVDAGLCRGLGFVGTSGSPDLRWALENGDAASESAFESLVRAELLAAGLPRPQLQHVVRLGGGATYRLDLAWPDLRLAVEADGAAVHANASALRNDLRRQNALVAAGWTLLRFTWADLGRIAAPVRDALRRAGRAA